MSGIEIRKISITDVDADVIVNAANDRLLAGGGVCGAIFRAAGYEQLQAACDAIGHCDTGSAVITPGFNVKARYIIHAVGPRWAGGNHGESQLLYSAYRSSLERAVKMAARPLLSRSFPRAFLAIQSSRRGRGQSKLVVIFLRKETRLILFSPSSMTPLSR